VRRLLLSAAPNANPEIAGTVILLPVILIRNLGADLVECACGEFVFTFEPST
jgi:hypothetical protein